MRTKTLLIAAAALVAGVISSEAQTVYSVNVAGYVTYISQTNTPGYEALDNPVDNGTNTLKSILPTAPGGTQVLLWSASQGTYITALFTAAQGGHWKTNGILADAFPIPPGTGFFISPAGTTPFTNVFTGNVAIQTGATGTNSIAAGFQMIGSVVPFADNITNTATLNLTGVAGGTQILLWNVGSQGFDTYLFSAGQGGKWKLNGVNTNVIVNVGQGFFLDAGSTYNWGQVGP